MGTPKARTAEEVRDNRKIRKKGRKKNSYRGGVGRGRKYVTVDRGPEREYDLEGWCKWLE